MRHAITDIEAALRQAVDYSKINYLMLMMVDPHVHFHVIPRYEGQRKAKGLSIEDKGWPNAPALGDAVELEAGQTAALVAWLRECWPSARCARVPCRLPRGSRPLDRQIVG